jgi:hypothetical protein
MADPVIVKEWLAKAESDFKFAEAPTNYTKDTAEEAHAALIEISNAVLTRINLP